MLSRPCANPESRTASKKLAQKFSSACGSGGRETNGSDSSASTPVTSPKVATVIINSCRGSEPSGILRCRDSSRPNSYILPFERVMPKRRLLLNPAFICRPSRKVHEPVSSEDRLSQPSDKVLPHLSACWPVSWQALLH